MVIPDADQLETLVWTIGILLAIVGSFVAVWWIGKPGEKWKNTLSSRFVHGVPWGSIVVVLGVLGFYLFGQGGFWHWNDPVTVPFTATSYFYPLGMLTAAFAHSSASHLTNNLLSTLLLAPLAEYVWGHYPERGSNGRNRYVTNPYYRAFVIFPGAVFLVGIATSLFAWGPVIGFSGVVFAFVGFSLVKFPLITIVALVGRTAIHVVTAALSNPVVVAEATTTFSRPSWAGTAVQGHALGLLIGVALGGIVLWYRRDNPDPIHLWIGSLFGGMALSLWAFWWVRGSETYVLYRGAGVIFVFLLAVIITVALVASDRPFWGQLTYRQTAVMILCIPLLTMALVAVPLNITVVSVDNPDRGVEINGEYLVFYDTEVEDQMFSVIDISMFGETTRVTTSGVIVASDDRQIWRRVVSSAQLAHAGERTVTVGGLGWRESVHVERQGWEPVGNDSVYAVWLQYDGNQQLTFTSEPQVIEPIIADHQLTILSKDGNFYLEVDGPFETEQREIPTENSSVSIGELIIHNTDGDLIAEHDEGTSVRIASVETYN